MMQSDAIVAAVGSTVRSSTIGLVEIPTIKYCIFIGDRDLSLLQPNSNLYPRNARFGPQLEMRAALLGATRPGFFRYVHV